MKEKIKIEINHYAYILNRALDTQEFNLFSEIDVSELEDIIDRLCDKIDDLNDEIKDIEQDIEDNYRRITKGEQYDE